MKYCGVLFLISALTHYFYRKQVHSLVSSILQKSSRDVKYWVLWPRREVVHGNTRRSRLQETTSGVEVKVISSAGLDSQSGQCAGQFDSEQSWKNSPSVNWSFTLSPGSFSFSFSLLLMVTLEWSRSLARSRLSTKKTRSKMPLGNALRWVFRALPIADGEANYEHTKSHRISSHIVLRFLSFRWITGFIFQLFHDNVSVFQLSQQPQVKAHWDCWPTSFCHTESILCEKAEKKFRWSIFYSNGSGKS